MVDLVITYNWSPHQNTVEMIKTLESLNFYPFLVIALFKGSRWKFKKESKDHISGVLCHGKLQWKKKMWECTWTTRWKLMLMFSKLCWTTTNIHYLFLLDYFIIVDVIYLFYFCNCMIFCLARSIIFALFAYCLFSKIV